MSLFVNGVFVKGDSFILNIFVLGMSWWGFKYLGCV